VALTLFEIAGIIVIALSVQQEKRRTFTCKRRKFGVKVGVQCVSFQRHWVLAFGHRFFFCLASRAAVFCGTVRVGANLQCSTPRLHRDHADTAYTSGPVSTAKSPFFITETEVIYYSLVVAMCNSKRSTQFIRYAGHMTFLLVLLSFLVRFPSMSSLPQTLLCSQFHRLVFSCSRCPQFWAQSSTWESTEWTPSTFVKSFRPCPSVSVLHLQDRYLNYMIAPIPPKQITIEKGRVYETDEWMNTPSSILSAIPRRLHLQSDHPIAITRKLIESRFPDYTYHNEHFPVVSVAQNFDSLGFPPDHIGRSRTDTYYLNKETVLRTHTSAHQADTFRQDQSAGWLISADVYRRDAIDRSHYPVFHQMEGARTWDRDSLKEGKTLAQTIWDDVEKIPKHDIKVEDPNPTFHEERNPLQTSHSAEEVEAIAAHLKRSLEDVVVAIFSAARTAAAAAASNAGEPPLEPTPLKVRWVEAYFPFTTPSWELEVEWQGDWLEVLGCGIVKQDLLNNSGVPNRLGWAFGIGLERIAMLLYNIPDIRLFWSQDPRFLDQFDEKSPIQRYLPFSKYPACIKDVSFWLATSSSAAGGHGHNDNAATRLGASGFHENDVMELAREVGGDVVEDVRLVDEFVHPKTGRRSMCYRINYRALDRTLTNKEMNELHSRFRTQLVQKLGVELR
jgi:phenylalanyl-tRNA synthetase alpha chain